MRSNPEPIGKRIARLRSEQGWTQQTLADRLAISRVAISHIEMGLSLPSERTVTLIAGVFKLQPHELVENTSFPRAKAERLPHTVTQFTRLELDLALLENDLRWAKKMVDGDFAPAKREVRASWLARLNTLIKQTQDPEELEMLKTAIKELRNL